MQSIQSWWQEQKGESTPWLIVGKGPTFSRREEFDLSGFRVVTINHTIREMPADIASFIDLEALRDCAADVERNAKFLLLPRTPHLKNAAGDRALDSLLGEFPVLKKFDEEKRLLWYNLASSTNTAPGAPTVPYGHFSGEVILTLLAMLGAKKIRTLGLDGGKAYATQFSDLESTRLINGKNSFDAQSQGIARAIQKYDLDCGPLTSEVPMRLFIGTDESQLLGARLLEYSVRLHSTATSTFDNMMHVKVPFPKDPRNHPRTGFSFNRFAIPKLAGYKGKAVYVDADMLVFRDFRDMWDTPFNGAKILYAPTSDGKRAKQFSVLLLDCERLQWDVDEIIRGMDEGKYDYDGLMKECCIEPADAIRDGLPPEWNSLEIYEPGKTGLLHYTDMHLQPWVSRHNPNGEIWEIYLKNAIRDGFITWNEVQDNLKKGFIRPSLVWQMKLPRSTWAKFKRFGGRILDRRYQPHQALAQRAIATKALIESAAAVPSAATPS